MNISFRRFLKHVLKNAQRLAWAERDKFIQSQVAPLGFWVNDFSELSYVLRTEPRRGHVLKRIGRAALKQKKVVNLLDLSLAKDMRTVSFFMPVFLKTPQEVIMWKVWPAKPVERKIGV